MKYLHWDEKTIADFSADSITAMYECGFVFNRLGKGVMQQTRSVRIDLSRFEFSSENRRIIKKTADISFSAEPLPYSVYDFKVGKLAKDFYDTKFGPGTMSANKAKEMLTDSFKSSFNLLLRYNISVITDKNENPDGYAICYQNASLLHYSYPFYDLNAAPKDMGLGMMVRAIEYAQAKGLKYI